MIAKNNIFNIRASKGKWNGQTGVSRGFCEYKSVAWCVRAALKLLLFNYPWHGAHTIAECIRRWAPPQDHNDTEAYIRFVCTDSLTPDTVVSDLSMSDLLLMLRKMAKMETGYDLKAEEFNEGFKQVFIR